MRTKSTPLFTSLSTVASSMGFAQPSRPFEFDVVDFTGARPLEEVYLNALQESTDATEPEFWLSPQATLPNDVLYIDTPLENSDTVNAYAPSDFVLRSHTKMALCYDMRVGKSLDDQTSPPSEPTLYVDQPQCTDLDTLKYEVETKVFSLLKEIKAQPLSDYERENALRTTWLQGIKALDRVLGATQMLVSKRDQRELPSVPVKAMQKDISDIFSTSPTNLDGGTKENYKEMRDKLQSYIEYLSHFSPITESKTAKRLKIA